MKAQFQIEGDGVSIVEVSSEKAEREVHLATTWENGSVSVLPLSRSEARSIASALMGCAADL
ncbi:MAG TPA: hypothetical protein VJL07_02665 [Dehalococcoidia bacterium]|nr:hypothetical protein [Dehalococcoidia bacterium]